MGENKIEIWKGEKKGCPVLKYFDAENSRGQKAPRTSSSSLSSRVRESVASARMVGRSQPSCHVQGEVSLHGLREGRNREGGGMTSDGTVCFLQEPFLLPLRLSSSLP